MSCIPLASSFLVLLVLCGAAGASAPSGDDWPSFRGPSARGVAEGHALVASFDVAKGENVRWRTPIPGLAHSAPVISGARVFVSSAIRKSGAAELKVGLYGDPNAVEAEGEHDFVVLALDKATGAVQWQQTAWSGTPKHGRHPKSSYAASTPATDGKHLVVNFGSEGLFCFDLDGKELWKRDLGDLDAGPYNMTDVQWGYASSPVIHDGKVLVQCDVLSQGFLAAFDVASGAELWRTKREDISTWSTPTVDVRPGRAQVICNGFKHIGAYELATGKELWKLVGGGDAPVPAPVVVEDLVLITNAHGRLAPIYAISAEAEGLITPEHEAMIWCHLNRGNYMQTPLVYGEELYLLSDAGILACLDLATGEQHYRERLGDGATGFTASMVAGDGKLYATSEEGGVHVLAAGTSFERVAEVELGETCMATPAISAGVLFWRTRSQLVAVGERAVEAK
ncbi:MAG: PQQ-binding-like beta-propeller repeat protein [Planctomycetes bacterium]|nr:PQQ-binding-like beta-propeller repeat protein [Planctomycetota bacterium]